MPKPTIAMPSTPITMVVTIHPVVLRVQAFTRATMKKIPTPPISTSMNTVIRIWPVATPAW
jgi:hypothetical protein